MTAPAPLLSVIVPVYNGARFLAAALAAVESQSYRPIETIVVDDGSTDASAAVAASRPGVTLLRRTHGGVAVARNAGLEAARGAWIAFLDADDLWHPAKLARQAAVLQRNGALRGVLCRFRNFRDAGFPPPDWVRSETFMDRRTGAMPSLCTLLARRAVFDEVGRFRPELENGEDLDWFARARDLGVSFEMVPEALVERRLHDANLSYRARRDGALMLRILRDSIARTRRGGEGDRPAVPSASGEEERR